MRWTEAEYQQHLENKMDPASKKKQKKQADAKTPSRQKSKKPVKTVKPVKKVTVEDKSLKDVLTGMGLGAKIKKPKKSVSASAKNKKQSLNSEKPKKKRQGIKTSPIFTSLQECQPQSMWGKNWLAVNMEGARVFTYNDIASILQYRKYEAFKYKKMCRDLISRAIKNGPKNIKKPFFDGPTRLTLVRIGINEMDNDAVPVAFKYFIDAFKKEKSNDKKFDKNTFFIDDDNPDIIVDIRTIQSKGEPRLALLFERLDDEWKKKHVPTWKEWVNCHVGQDKAKSKVTKKDAQKVVKKSTKKVVKIH